jgi:hypothetical protein
MKVRSFLLLAVLCLAPIAAHAGIIDVTVDTSALVGHPAGPFYLEFSLNDGSGSGDGNNTVIVDNFDFGGGSASGSSALLGGASGDLSSGVTLSDSFSFADLVQAFTPGSTLTFRVTTTNNVDPGTPDSFFFFILDSSQAWVPTLAPSFGNYFLTFNIDGDPPTLASYASDNSISPSAGGPPINIAAPQASFGAAAVPEPGMALPLAAGFGMIAFFRKRGKVTK